MFTWRITKYNPQYRASDGIYAVETWTSYSDIGNVYNEKELTYEDYLQSENAYIATVMACMDCLSLESMRVVCLEKTTVDLDDTYFTTEMIQVFNTVKNDHKLAKELVPDLCRLVLRELIWCKLESLNMYVHFGYDFYMYIGVSNMRKKTMLEIKKTGLFVEEYQSPYAC